MGIYPRRRRRRRSFHLGGGGDVVDGGGDATFGVDEAVHVRQGPSSLTHTHAARFRAQLMAQLREIRDVT